MAPPARRIWWATWPGALALGLLSLAMIAVSAVPVMALAVGESEDPTRSEAMSWDGPPVGLRVAWAALAVACFALPGAVVVVARRRWLGWVLATLTASLVVLGVGLAALGFL